MRSATSSDEEARDARSTATNMDALSETAPWNAEVRPFTQR